MTQEYKPLQFLIMKRMGAMIDLGFLMAESYSISLTNKTET